MRFCVLFEVRILWIFQYNFNTYHFSIFAYHLKIAFRHSVWKLLKMSHLNFWILAFSANFCPIKTDLSGNTVWPKASGFRLQCLMRPFLWFSETVKFPHYLFLSVLSWLSVSNIFFKKRWKIEFSPNLHFSMNQRNEKFWQHQIVPFSFLASDVLF